ncbi:MAG: GNAT family N-acetyltransferase, partial [Thermoplasmata archaeon]
MKSRTLPVELTACRVRRAEEADLEWIAAIGSDAFSGLRPLERAERWVRASFRASPRMAYWVAEDDGAIVGYILWIEKGGFRDRAVVELEQVAVERTYQGRGVGTALVRQSLEELERAIEARGARLKVIEVTTGTQQNAAEFYRRTLGAEVVATIPDLFRGDERVLIARRGNDDRRTRNPAGA